MANAFRTILGLDETDISVQAQLERTNRDVLMYETIFITIVSSCALISTFFPIAPWDSKTSEAHFVYRIGLFFISAMSIACHLICARLAKSSSDSTQKTRIVLIVYTTLILVTAVAVNAYDYANSGSFFVYVVALVFVYGLLSIQPLITIITVLGSSSTLFVLLLITGSGNSVTAMTLAAYAFIVIVISVSSYHTRKRATESGELVRKVARYDALTEVKNRRALIEEVPSVIGQKTYVLLGDIDDFKFYNDSFGHGAGDELLREFAKSMCQAFGRDNVYRYGGDEFMAIALNVKKAEFQDRVSSWRKTFAGIVVDGEHYIPTVSGGFVYGEPHNENELQDMLRLADIRLYDAKQAGRNKVLGMTYEGREDAAAKFDADHLRERRSGSADPLTGLPSMVYFNLHARSLLESTKLADVTFYLVYFNIENMKTYNERFGIAGGDELLVFTAHSIEESFEHALVARVGDDRFVLLTYDKDPIEGIEHVHEAVRTHNSASNTIIRAGLYRYERGVEVSAACDLAKLACDYIKGHHNVYLYVYDENLHETRERKQFILDRFEDALTNGNIQVYYQPIVRCLNGRISEFEALARWIDPVDGFISPGDFIPVLEEFRLVHLLDLRIIECVCNDIRTVSDEGLRPVPVNVNLSRYDAKLCDIAGETARILERFNIAPTMVNIEITESAFFENTNLLRDTIKRFHDLGMQVWMDDFGSGYSSLNVLREFNFDVVKFDMFFLRHSNETSRDRSRMMIPHLINMVKELGIQTLAEGVETNDQYESLRSVGCEKVQGFAFEKPSPIERVRVLLEDGHEKVEAPEERIYYDPIGQVDLSSPMAIDPDLAHSIELSGGMPAALVEFRDGRVSYLHWNSSYLDYLKDIHMDTIENSVAQMNDLSRPQSQGFFKAAEHQRGKPGWLTISFYEDKDLCTGMGRCVAVDNESGAVAFLYIAFNVTHYLARAGLSLPEQTSTQ